MHEHAAVAGGCGVGTFRRGNPPSWRGRFFRRESGGDLPPPIFFEKENAPRPVEKKLFLFWVRAWWTLGRAKASLRSRPLGRWARRRAVLPTAPAPSTAPVAARPVWGTSSETNAPSTANLRQQGVAESLLVLARPMVADAYSTHRTRAAQ